MTQGVLANSGTVYSSIKDSADCLLTYQITSQQYTLDNVNYITSTDISLDSSTAHGRVILTLPN